MKHVLITSLPFSGTTFLSRRLEDALGASAVGELQEAILSTPYGGIRKCWVCEALKEPCPTWTESVLGILRSIDREDAYGLGLRLPGSETIIESSKWLGVQDSAGFLRVAHRTNECRAVVMMRKPIDWMGSYALAVLDDEPGREVSRRLLEDAMELWLTSHTQILSVLAKENIPYEVIQTEALADSNPQFLKLVNSLGAWVGDVSPNRRPRSHMLGMNKFALGLTSRKKSRARDLKKLHSLAKPIVDTRISEIRLIYRCFGFDDA